VIDAVVLDDATAVSVASATATATGKRVTGNTGGNGRVAVMDRDTAEPSSRLADCLSVNDAVLPGILKVGEGDFVRLGGCVGVLPTGMLRVQTRTDVDGMVRLGGCVKVLPMGMLRVRWRVVVGSDGVRLGVSVAAALVRVRTRMLMVAAVILSACVGLPAALVRVREREVVEDRVRDGVGATSIVFVAGGVRDADGIGDADAEAVGGRVCVAVAVMLLVAVAGTSNRHTAASDHHAPDTRISWPDPAVARSAVGIRGECRRDGARRRCRRVALRGECAPGAAAPDIVSE